MIILDASGNPIGRGDGTAELAAGLTWAAETPELLARLQSADAESQEYPELDAVCAGFRECCTAIEDFLPVEYRPFRGGYDEIGKLAAVPDLLDLPAAVRFGFLTQMLSGLNQAANHEANKVGMDSPRWWYRCWQLGEFAPC